MNERATLVENTEMRLLRLVDVDRDEMPVFVDDKSIRFNQIAFTERLFKIAVSVVFLNAMHVFDKDGAIDADDSRRTPKLRSVPIVSSAVAGLAKRLRFILPFFVNSIDKNTFQTLFHASHGSMHL